jgi:hypothetical protein
VLSHSPFCRCPRYRSFSISNSDAISGAAHRARRYLGLAAGAAFTVCAAVASINAVVDPFGTVRLIEREGFNKYKPAMQTRVRLVKAAEVRRVRPEAIVLGTSRSHVALKMTHEGWHASPRYNLSFDGAMPEEMDAYLRHAQAIQPLEQVVLGLDTWQLGTGPSGVRPDFDETLLYRPDATWTRLRARLADLRLLLSLDTLGQSLHTVLSQRDGEPDWFAADGQRLGDIFFHRAGEEFMTRGPAAYFAAIDRLEVGFKLPAPRPARARHGATNDAAQPTSFDHIRRIVEFCRANAIDLRIFITPMHAHQMEISAEAGEWETIENGKRALVRLLGEDAAARHTAPFPLWDFSGYSSVTTEAVPPVGSRSEMRFYWDSSHFKEVVGDFVLDRLFAIEHPTRPVPADFGQLLTPQDVERVLAEIRADHLRYRIEHPHDIATIREMVASARGESVAPLRSAAAR